ncbi:hypothetical protein D9M68_991920 [compost metagenome]
MICEVVALLNDSLTWVVASFISENKLVGNTITLNSLAHSRISEYPKTKGNCTLMKKPPAG